MDKKYVCPCGLVCCECLFYEPEIYETAKKLKNVIKSSQLDVFLKSITENEAWSVIAKHLNEEGTEIQKYFEAFKKMPEFLNVLDGLIQLQCKKTCQEAGGCSMGGTTHVCEALECIKTKGYNGCWDCSEFKSCKKLSFLKGGYGKTIEENLNLAKEKGVEAVKLRGDKYYAWKKKQ